MSLQRLHLVFPIVKLTLVAPDPILGHALEPPQPLLLVEGNEEYKVEGILDSRMHYNRLEYLIKWKGYNAGHNSWAIYRDVHAPDAIAEFHRQHPRIVSPRLEGGVKCKGNPLPFGLCHSLIHLALLTYP